MTSTLFPIMVAIVLLVPLARTSVSLVRPRLPSLGTAKRAGTRHLMLFSGLAGVTVLGFLAYRALTLCAGRSCDWTEQAEKIRHRHVVSDYRGRDIGTLERYPFVYLDSLPDFIPVAFTVLEDARYDRHPGIDPVGVGRASLHNALVATRISRSRGIQGASTVAMHVFWMLSPADGARTDGVNAKLRESLAALQLIRVLGRDTVLEIYVNNVPLGRGAHGIAEAADKYFGCRASELTLDQAALLAAAVRSPGRVDPDQHFYDALAERDRVLMRVAELYPRFRPAVARAVQVRTIRRCAPRPRPYGEDVLRLAGHHASRDSAATTRLSIDLDLQRIAEDAVTASARSIERGCCGSYRWRSERSEDRLQLMYAALDYETGEIRAMVCGRRDLRWTYDRCSNALIPPSSTIKPIIAATLFDLLVIDTSDDFITLATKAGNPQLADAWTERQCQRSPFTALADGLANSSNCLAALLYHLLPPDGLSKIHQLGFAAEAWQLTDALGVRPTRMLGVAAAYAAIANGGLIVRPRWSPVEREDRSASADRLWSEVATAQIRELLAGVARQGTGSAVRAQLADSTTVYVKTGTGSDGKVMLIAGISPATRTASVLVALHDRPRTILGGSASAGPVLGPTWGRIEREYSAALARRRGLPRSLARPGSSMAGVLAELAPRVDNRTSSAVLQVAPEQ